jgi:hypothetical protein
MINKSIVDSYYRSAKNDLNCGICISEINASLAFFEEIENYEACEGILRAINEYKLNNNKNEV